MLLSPEISRDNSNLPLFIIINNNLHGNLVRMVNGIWEHSFLSKVEITSLPSTDASNFQQKKFALILSIIILKGNNCKNSYKLEKTLTIIYSVLPI